MMGEKNAFPVELTIAQMESLNEFIESCVFDAIRSDPDIDGFAWLKNILFAHEQFERTIERIREANYHGDDEQTKEVVAPIEDENKGLKEKLGGVSNEPEPKRKRIDIGKVIALRNAGWSHAKIADEMGVQPGSIAQAIYKYKKEAGATSPNEEGE